MVSDLKQVSLESFIDKENNLTSMIKANKKLFKSISMINTYIKTFVFNKKRLQIQIKVIENYKSKIISKSIAFATLANIFLENGFWIKFKQTKKQFIEIIKPFLVLKIIISKIKSQNTNILKTIANNQDLATAKNIKKKTRGILCL